MQQIKCLAFISGVELASGSSLFGGINVKSKDILILEKEAIIGLKDTIDNMVHS